MLENADDRRALYLRWRPRTFADVVGQEHVVRTLRNAVASGTPAHAYLLAGPRGTGKTSIARIFYRAVNCENTNHGEPCGECESCRGALAGNSLDLVEIDAASNRGIDDVRDLREKVAFSPAEVRYRVYIVDEAHELTAPAWDAFLKTLEEPPPHAIFVLATTEAHKIPGTIVSRCQRFDLRRINPRDISRRLIEIAASEGLQLEPAAADRLARMARGGLRDAISLLDQASSFSGGSVDLQSLRQVLGLPDDVVVHRLLEAVAQGSTPEAFSVLLDVVESGTDPRLFADEVVVRLRGLLYASVGASRALAGELSPDDMQWIDDWSSRWDGVTLRELLRGLTEAAAKIRDSGQFQLHLELAILNACGGIPRLQQGVASIDPASPASAEHMRFSESTEPTGTPALMESPGERERAGALSVLTPEAPPELTTRASVVAQAASSIPGEIEAESASAVVSMQTLRERWPRIIEWVANRNSFVASYLRPAELTELKDGWLVLRFAFKVHHERVAEEKNRSLVEDACRHVVGQHLRVRCEHQPPAALGPSEELDLDDPVLKFALETFGGTAEWADR